MALTEIQKRIDNFFKEYGNNRIKKAFKINGKCHIGNIKNCKFYKIKDGAEICKRGWCLAK